MGAGISGDHPLLEVSPSLAPAEHSAGRSEVLEKQRPSSPLPGPSSPSLQRRTLLCLLSVPSSEHSSPARPPARPTGSSSPGRGQDLLPSTAEGLTNLIATYSFV